MNKKTFELYLQDVGFRRWDQIKVRSTGQEATVIRANLTVPQGTIKLTVLPFRWSRYRLFRIFQRLYIIIKYR